MNKFEKAPDWAIFWVMTKCGQAWWVGGDVESLATIRVCGNGWRATGFGVKTEKAPRFKYKGFWQSSIELRP